MSDNMKLKDNKNLRTLIELSFKNMTPVNQSKWALSLAIRVLNRVGINYLEIPEVVNGIKKNERWQTHSGSEYDVRNAAFAVQTLATKYTDITMRTAIRMIGHAIASGDRSDHALVSSDYAIKVIDLITDNNKDEINKERNWQLTELKKFT